jgi:hypothetical protein
MVLTLIFLIYLIAMMDWLDYLDFQNQGNPVILPIMVKMFLFGFEVGFVFWHGYLPLCPSGISPKGENWFDVLWMVL